MIPYVRRTKILDILTQKDIATIEEIQQTIPEVSTSTLRRDLKELEKEGKVVLLSGGAMKLHSGSMDLPISKKTSMYKKEKEVIAELASSLIEDGDTIYLDSGTTCTALMMKICKKRITIVTSNTEILTLDTEIKAEVIFLGGTFNSAISSVFGPVTDNNLAQFNFDKAFIGTTGIDIAMGISTPSIFEANKKANAIRRSKRNYVLCDSSKFHKGALTKAFDLEEAIVISDRKDAKIATKTQMLVP